MAPTDTPHYIRRVLLGFPAGSNPSLVGAMAGFFYGNVVVSLSKVNEWNTKQQSAR